MSDILLGQIRHLMTIGAGVLYGKGYISEIDAISIVGVAMALLTMFHSWWTKRRIQS